MLTVLATHWRLLLIRALAAVLFGIGALLWPALTPTALALLFGLYAFIDGVLALIVALATRELPGFASLLVQGVVGVAAGVAASLYPDITPVVLLAVIAGWAIVTGVASIATAVTLRRELTGEWPLPVAGTLLVILGLLLLLNPVAGALAKAWIIGLFAILVGIALVALAIRLRKLAQEMARA